MEPAALTTPRRARPFVGRPRIVCVSNGPLPYHTPILNALAEFTSVHVLYMSRGHPLNSFTDLWGEAPRYPHTFHWSKAMGMESIDFRAQVSVGSALRLRQLDPDVVLVSSWGPLVWEPLVWARRRRRGSVMWAESTMGSGLLRGRTSHRGRRLVVRLADAFVANGTQAASYLRALGVADRRVVVSRLPSPVGCDPRVAVEPPASTMRLLFVGRLIERKRPLDVIEAVTRLGQPGVTLTMVGDGPLSERVERAAAPLGNRVSLLGRVEGEALRDVYRRSDVLVVPSEREVWGLVVNEALAHGLYVVASDQTASATDLLDDVAGRLVPTGDVDALVAAVSHAYAAVDFSSLGRDTRARAVASVTPRSFAADILRAAIISWSSRRQR